MKIFKNGKLLGEMHSPLVLVTHDRELQDVFNTLKRNGMEVMNGYTKSDGTIVDGRSTVPLTKDSLGLFQMTIEQLGFRVQ